MKYSFVLVLFSLVLTSCALVDFGEKVGTNVGETLLPSEEATTLRQTCELRAVDLFPGTLTLVNTSAWYLKNVTWSDGVFSTTSVRYRNGEKDGENINHAYPANVIEDNHVRYQRQLLSESGTILGTREFSVKFVLEPIVDTLVVIEDETFKRPLIRQQYRIVGHEFKSCDWVTDSK